MKRSKRYVSNLEKLDKNKAYSAIEAVKLVKETSNAKFDSTIEVAMNLNLDTKKNDQQLRGAVVLPNGTGKTKRILVLAKGDQAKAAKEAGADFVGDLDMIQKIEKESWFDYDVIIATPEMMPMLGKIGKLLGPKGLMPNPKTGTVTMDTAKAIELGAEGIGLCRTEHMFFEEDRIPKIRKMILSETVEDRTKALDELIPFQKGDFKAMYKELKNLPMTVRYLDPPLHEFLPTLEEDIIALAKDMNVTVEHLKNKIAELHEFNPMMGHRGCRLAVTYPEIARMQTRALMEAAIEVKEEEGYDITPEIMIPLVGEEKELKFVKDIVVEVAEEVKREYNSDMKYHIGTMIEIPRAALTADAIAKEAEFFSFGTNDLTQMTFGFSRDDAGKFLDAYYQNKIYEIDPFAKLDQVGVGQLVKMAAEKGRNTRPDIKLGICGEHGGEPTSVEFCHNIGLNYVSCSPYRVPIARLAAAQAAINNGDK